MKKNSKVIIIFMIIVLLSSCLKKENSNEFFAWMDAYIAIDKGTENAIAITLFYEKEPFNKEDIAHIKFIDINKEVEIKSFNVESSNQLNKRYSSYGITLNYIANKTGIYETSGVEITFKSNKSIEYPVGDWKFDISEKSADVIDSWNSPVASTNSEKFLYDYKIIEPDAKIERIYYGEDLYVEDNISNQGLINIDNYDSPIVYVKSKIITSINGSEKIDYGKGCYCGAIGFSEDTLNLSKEHNNIK